MTMIDDINVLYSILFFLWLQYLWELYLEIRQYRVCQHTKDVPQELRGVMNKDIFDKARSYSIDKSSFGFVKSAVSIITSTFIIYTGLLAKVWNYSQSNSPWEGEVATSCIWLFILTTLSSVLDLPFSIYYTFVLEEKYGFNKQTATFFTLDKIKAYILSQSLTLPICSIIILIVKYGGEYFFVWLWITVGVILMVLLTIYPSYIAPLFDKYTPLPEGELRTNIEKLASELKFPLDQLYVVEGSKRSAHSNAYFYGLFAKRIVLFDTLLAKPESGGCENDEVLAVLSHELGHWKHSHITKRLIIMQTNLLLVFLVFAFMFRYPPIYQAVGFPTKLQPVLVGLLVVMQYIMVPYNELLSFLLTCLSRYFEFQADKFATKLKKAEPLQRALIQLNKDNLGFPVYDSLYSAWHHSHPPLLQRLDALKTKQD
ncbi:hypothetical protein PPYR_04939 [Photinus pyralis]|uniref:CAAX prenyl protease n=1 Tax=Photinus pyralis TaxID=7054 RepID=A0A5N3ZZU5_PHOPY|nr:CAAX prenyl protease 1 homolog [Photinus pyralis]XP_031358120.1 CAAX prenyl protease 1 homolog [Photinus pyralis]KAB0790576.1 hypothetical protein PPYR_15017 [Photinus pyralis]KAB0802753.1 hypothetical protein PPYR_04939 [Photinus pyralis]